MGKKRRGPTLDELLARPWCYYCERDFDDLKILISHQKAKHFKCERCGRRLNTAGGLSVHMSQVHKEQLAEVDNALPNRASLDVEIFGMEGVPEDVVQTHNQRVMAQFQQAEAERQAVTGNPPAGSSVNGQPAKKPKLEAVSDLKRRLAEHKAKRAELLQGGSSGEATPVGAGQASPAATPTSATTATTTTAPAFTYPQPYNSASPFPQTASPVYPNFSPSGQQYPPPQYPAGISPQPAQPGAYGATPSPVPPQQPQPQQQSQQQPPQTHTPPQPSFLSRPGALPATLPTAPGLPAAPGLPQRPAFGAPQVNAHQMQQLHMGHPAPPGAAAVTPDGPVLASVDELVSGAAKQADQHAEEVAAAAAAAAASTSAKAPDDKPKKERSKVMRLVYPDNETSPEERMSRLPRYAFVPDRVGETVLGELPAAVVVGAIRDSDTVIDTTH
ncbi:hypothetical protein ASPZODRAFT_131249 [Penicilliopsis zonata CBS 506.65]|uniref:C2H2-type domain-containing protein n=1 Tax=Penicilliopsis zonata CBS 506.65 TaxID=1073090 RepID=A0A1L9SKU6_9EURO|nr:hypothetical protein ASPZODRAFT_131249 [Penicilliopsis zonata CBS 506.65]OJJ47694.1 hypothetical protein ASPZODRAFT_131249 [Penicilliopsis zonata CBS 506.65]